MTVHVRAVLPAALLLVGAVSATGCSGPQQRLDFGGKAVPINVAFGKPPTDRKATPVPGTVLQPVPGGIGVVPFAPGTVPAGSGGSVPVPSAGAALDPCPAQDPFKFPRREATNVVEQDVPEGQFPFRISGSYTQNGKKTQYSQTVYETVKRLASDPAGRKRFSVHDSLLGIAYTATYVVTPPPDPNVAGEIGLESMVEQGGDNASFTPAKPLRLLQTRAEKGVTWTDATSDPLSATSATVSGVITDKARINACGQPVEAWKAQVSQRLISQNQDITSTRTLYFGTGYGGLLVGEHNSYSGTARGDTVSGESTTLINVDPGAP